MDEINKILYAWDMFAFIQCFKFECLVLQAVKGLKKPMLDGWMIFQNFTWQDNWNSLGTSKYEDRKIFVYFY